MYGSVCLQAVCIVHGALPQLHSKASLSVEGEKLLVSTLNISIPEGHLDLLLSLTNPPSFTVGLPRTLNTTLTAEYTGGCAIVPAVLQRLKENSINFLNYSICSDLLTQSLFCTNVGQCRLLQIVSPTSGALGVSSLCYLSAGVKKRVSANVRCDSRQVCISGEVRSRGTQGRELKAVIRENTEGEDTPMVWVSICMLGHLKNALHTLYN